MEKEKEQNREKIAQTSTIRMLARIKKPNLTEVCIVKYRLFTNFAIEPLFIVYEA